MYLGKKKCRILKGIRMKIAAANGISYTPHKCNHRGDCHGTCPACEQEMRHIENELNRRRSLGKAAVVVGTALGLGVLTSGVSSCNHKPFNVVGDVPNIEKDLRGKYPAKDYKELEGDVAKEITVDSTASDSTVVEKQLENGTPDSDITP